VSTATASERRPRLNPFAFPSDTAFRFGLLVAAVIGANLYVWQWIGSTTRRDEALAGAGACLQLSPARATSSAQFAAATDAFGSCVAHLYRYQVWWMLGGTAALLAVAAAILLCAPLWITRRRKLRPLTSADVPAAVAAVAELAREQGLEPPRLLWNPLDASAGGLAFGRPGRYSIAVGAGLVVQQATDPPAFAAVVRHELAHIRNRDVGITYFTLAVWYAFLLVAVLPFVFTLLDDGRTLTGVVWRLAVLALLVYLTRNAVLRSREVYADLRASVPDGPGGALRRVLGGLPRPQPSVLGKLRSVHPDPARRLAALEDTRPLFPLGAAVAFAAGLTATIAFESVVQLLSSFVDDPFDLHLLAGLVFVPLAAGVVGIAIWREAFAAHADGRDPASPWADALALAAGFLVGPELALDRIATADSTLLRELGSAGGLLWAAVLVTGLVLLVAWIRTSASWWLRALGGRRPLAAQTAGLLVGGAALSSFTAVFSTVRELRPSLAFSRAASSFEHQQVDAQVWALPEHVWQFVMDGELLVIAHKPYFVPVLALLVLFPFAAVLARRGPLEAPWAFLDPGGRLETPPLMLRPLLPLGLGAAAGLAFLAAAVVLRFGVHYGAGAETRATDAAVLSFYVTTVALALAVQLVAGAAGAVRGGLVGALGAAFVAGCFGWLGIVGGPAVGGCIDPLSLNPGPCAWTVPASVSWAVFKQVIAEGAILGLAGGLAVVGAQALRHRRAIDELQPAGLAS
jgi:Zn-dependent protease with chaperone function